MAPLVGAPAPAFSAQAYMPDGSFKQLDLASFKVGQLEGERAHATITRAAGRVSRDPIDCSLRRGRALDPHPRPLRAADKESNAGHDGVGRVRRGGTRLVNKAAAE